MAAKAAANTMDMYATRDGIYRIKDGLLTNDIYDFDIYQGGTYYTDDLKYVKNENDAAKVFYSLLSYNNFIDYSLENTNDEDRHEYITSNNTNPIGNGNNTEKYVRVKYSQNADYANKKRASEFSFIVINNNYDYVDALVNTENLTRDNIILTNENININQVYETGETETISNIVVATENPTVVGVGVVKYELSPLFNIFGIQNIYLKEYATSELIISDNYWN